MSLPQPLHLAAALALVESKPKHLTIQAHVQSLRNSVETTHHDDQTLRRFDPVIFWRIQHDKLHDMLEIERAAMFVLQNENEVLQAQIAQLSARSKPGRKRKSAEQEEPETAKKMKAGTIAKAEFGSAGDADPVVRAMRHVHRVQSLCKGRMWNTDSNELAYNLIQAMQALGLIVEHLPRKVHIADSASKTVVAVAKSCISVFNGLKRMDSLDTNDHFASHVIHACVCFFDILFTSLEEGAAIQVKSKRPDQETPGLQALSQLAKGLVENLRDSANTCRSHANILEGAVYHLLHRLGEAVHELLLDGPREDNIEKEMRHLPLPEDKLLDPCRQTEMRGLLTSAPLLLDSLRKAVTDLSGMPFAGSARLRLQRTLVDRIFGPGTGSAEASHDVLRLPEVFGEPPKIVETVRTGDIQGRTNVFEYELWTLIGWDILGDRELW